MTSECDASGWRGLEAYDADVCEREWDAAEERKHPGPFSSLRPATPEERKAWQKAHRPDWLQRLIEQRPAHLALLRRYARGEGTDPETEALGMYYTPRRVTEWVLDPACGTGAFLAELEDAESDDETLIGQAGATK